MNLELVEKIAKAVLYEGYMLYPYRPSSVKNQQRWNFGVLCPQSYSVAQKGSEAWTMQTECLVEGSSMTGLEVRVRFLQLVERSVGELAMPVKRWLPARPPSFGWWIGLLSKIAFTNPGRKRSSAKLFCRCTTSRRWDTGWCLMLSVFRQKSNLNICVMPMIRSPA